MTRLESELNQSKVCTVNGLGDLMMDREKGKYIQKRVTIKRTTKKGMVICIAEGGEEVCLPPKNIELAS